MSSHSKDGTSYLDGVPVRISSSFIPPLPVALPLAYNAELSIDLDAEYYDFSFERNVLDSIQKRKAELEEKKVAKSRHEENSSQQRKISSSNMSLTSETSKVSAASLSLQSDTILQPKSRPHDQVPVPCKPKETKINLSDFENDTSSPFDLMELRTINDLAELSSVFQSMDNSASTDCSSTHESSMNVSKSNSFPIPQCYPSTEKITSSVSEDSSLTSAQICSEKHSVSQIPIEYPPLPDTGQQLSSIAAASTFNQKYVISNSFQPGNFYPTSYDLQRTVAQQPYFPVSSGTFKPALIDRNDFMDCRLGASSHVPYIPSSKGSALRSSKSYSDIHRLPDAEVITQEKERARTPPNSLFFDSVSLDPQTNKVCETEDRGASNGICDNSLQDPYDDLDHEDQLLIDSITEMGFPRPQVARSVKHLGADDKKVVEHLLQIQMLEESGYESSDAEAALHLHDYNRDKAKTYLDLVNQFQDLGFEKNAVKKALVQNKNDWNKTIDSLLPS